MDSERWEIPHLENASTSYCGEHYRSLREGLTAAITEGRRAAMEQKSQCLVIDVPPLPKFLEWHPKPSGARHG